VEAQAFSLEDARTVALDKDIRILDEFLQF
jgi:hypothetical protein